MLLVTAVDAGVMAWKPQEPGGFVESVDITPVYEPRRGFAGLSAFGTW